MSIQLIRLGSMYSSKKILLFHPTHRFLFYSFFLLAPCKTPKLLDQHWFFQSQQCQINIPCFFRKCFLPDAQVWD